MPNTIFTATNIYQAYLDCRISKRQTANALKFELDQENNLADLQIALLERTYQPARSICFVVTYPKPREIFAAEFTDRIVHHLLINQVEAIWEKHIFIPDSYACRKGKGNHFGVKRMARFAKQFTFYGQFDISNFFSKIDKGVLYDCFGKVIRIQKRPTFWKEEVLWLANVIIFNDPTRNYFYKGDRQLQLLLPVGKSLFDQEEDTGMPIGNLTSQFLANVYLHELDEYVTKTLGCGGYGRYVDDFVLFSNSKAELIFWRNSISAFLEKKLHLTLHPLKQQIQPTRHGIAFVGYFIKPWGITVRRNVVKRLKNKVYLFNQKDDTEYAIASLNSYFGHLIQAKSRTLRKHIVQEHLSPEFKAQISVVGMWHHFKRRHVVKKL